ncbi:hypothetical protein PanWU01x14_259990 [Parasponia andersonii]|uniref:Uncharacterized protein n=1 Tax=Parasponia andersonii TaxID=3476 RepID=A0A2P5B934_PARAD|nr:hypothetical protein PanWU01x14_259990 [Parasponia andersonii]
MVRKGEITGMNHKSRKRVRHIPGNSGRTQRASPRLVRVAPGLAQPSPVLLRLGLSPALGVGPSWAWNLRLDGPA